MGFRLFYGASNYIQLTEKGNAKIILALESLGKNCFLINIGNILLFYHQHMRRNFASKGHNTQHIGHIGQHFSKCTDNRKIQLARGTEVCGKV